MKGSTKLIAVTTLLVVAAVLVIHWLSRPKELTWKGKPGSYWIGRLSFFDLEGASSSAEEFLFAAGPEVVSELIRGLGLHDRWLSDRWVDVYFKLGK